MIIYKVTNVKNGKSYIGQTIQSLSKRRTKHLSRVRLGSTTHFHSAIRKHGSEFFLWEVIDTAYTRDELDELERSYIVEFDTFLDGYNSTTSTTHVDFTDDVISKIRRKATGRVASKEARDAMSRAQTDRFLNEDERKKISDARIQGGVAKGVNNPMYGRTHSEKTKQLQSEIRSTWISENGNPMSGRTHTEGAKAKISQASRAKTQCPYCGLVGGNRNMKRYHFDNCKQKVD